MKIRTGFVANSSTASFIVAFRGQPSLAAACKALTGADSDAPLGPVIRDIATELLEDLRLMFAEDLEAIKVGDDGTVEWDHYGDLAAAAQWHKAGYVVMKGYAASRGDGGEGTEAMLARTEIFAETPDFCIHKKDTY